MYSKKIDKQKASSALKISCGLFFFSKANFDCNFARVEDNNSNELDFFSQII